MSKRTLSKTAKRRRLIVSIIEGAILFGLLLLTVYILGWVAAQATALCDVLEAIG